MRPGAVEPFSSTHIGVLAASAFFALMIAAVVAFAARDGTTANDGNGRNSPYITSKNADVKKPPVSAGDVPRDFDVRRV